MRGLFSRLSGFLLLMTSSGWAHPSDISHLRVQVERQRVEMRFTFNLLSLSRFVEGLDANEDHRLEEAEIEAALPKLNLYLSEKVEMRVNGQKAALGEATAMECLWPAEDGVIRAAEFDYATRHVDFLFSQEARPLVADVWLGFSIWAEVGPLGSIEARYEQDGLITQVPFTQSEPDYLYDTGFATESMFQEPNKNKQQFYAPWLLWVATLSVMAGAFWWLKKV